MGISVKIGESLSWAAVEEFSISYHNMDIL